MASRAEEIMLTTCTQYAAYDHAKATTDCIAMASGRAPVYETQIRSPVDIVAVIDHSGSMADEKLNLVKKTLLFIIDQLKLCDLLCLVLYDNVVNVEFPLTFTKAATNHILSSLLLLSILSEEKVHKRPGACTRR